jgi:putative acyl-CoA dehydrogenase
MKYWVCKRGPAHAGEALECLGGNGYVEDSGLPRLYREAPLVSIWEGSGNVAALDTLRAMVREPEAVEAFFGELETAAGTDGRYDDALAMLQKQFSDTADLEYRARSVVERMALLLQGALLLRVGNPAVADAFVASRLARDWGVAYGTLPTGLDTATILQRAAVLS